MNDGSPKNQGGAIQYGYDSLILSTIIIISSCEFKRNSCENAMGGAIGFNVNGDITITSCIFESNKCKAEGGAIYITGQMSLITITDCKFIGNKGSDGSAIYVAGENIANAKLSITTCNFTDNGEDKSRYMIVSYTGECVFEHNKVECTDKTKTSGALSLHNPNIVTISDCKFTNCIVEASSTIDLINQNENSNTVINNCEFYNCKCDDYVIRISGGIVDSDSITILFDDSETACGGIDFGTKGFSVKNSNFIRTKSSTGSIKFAQLETKTDKVLINNCNFDSCAGTNAKCFSISLHTTDFTFSNNVVQNTIQSGSEGYIGLIDCNEKITTVLDNVSFINNVCDSNYGGGTGLKIVNTEGITFSKCSFINNVALKSSNPRGKDYFSGDGGGIQYRFSSSTSEVDIIFNECIFKRNKAVRHGGGIAIQTTKTVEITKCIFEENIANYNSQTKRISTHENYFDLKDEGRGGAIYINPIFSYNNEDFKMSRIDITGSQFLNNEGFDGYAIYIQTRI